MAQSWSAKAAKKKGMRRAGRLRKGKRKMKNFAHHARSFEGVRLPRKLVRKVRKEEQ